MDLQAATTVTGTQIGLTSTGIRARATDPIMLDNVKVDAVTRRRRRPTGQRGHPRHSAVHALKPCAAPPPCSGSTISACPR